jgi:hypothetical protein
MVGTPSNTHAGRPPPPCSNCSVASRPNRSCSDKGRHSALRLTGVAPSGPFPPGVVSLCLFLLWGTFCLSTPYAPTACARQRGVWAAAAAWAALLLALQVRGGAARGRCHLGMMGPSDLGYWTYAGAYVVFWTSTRLHMHSLAAGSLPARLPHSTAQKWQAGQRVS